ncbi:hypothetical protein SCA6_018439 [Theobroma cacao]
MKFFYYSFSSVPSYWQHFGYKSVKQMLNYGFLGNVPKILSPEPISLPNSKGVGSSERNFKGLEGDDKMKHVVCLEAIDILAFSLLVYFSFYKKFDGNWA